MFYFWTCCDYYGGDSFAAGTGALIQIFQDLTSSVTLITWSEQGALNSKSDSNEPFGCGRSMDSMVI